MDNENFTNDEDIKYPELDDFVDVRVLNNNTKLLDEKKVDLVQFNELVSDNLDGVAKESSAYNIEDGINNIKSTASNIEDGVNNIKTTASTINSNVNTINTNVSTINTNVSAIKTTTTTTNTNVNAINSTTSTINTNVNAITDTLKNVATTTNLTSLESKISDIDTKVNAIDERTETWWENGPSLIMGTSTTSTMVLGTEYEVLKITGSGYLTHWRGYKNQLAGQLENGKYVAQCQLTVSVDGSVYINRVLTMNFTNAYTGGNAILLMQIFNGQSAPWGQWGGSGYLINGPQLFSTTGTSMYYLPSFKNEDYNYSGYHMFPPSSVSQNSIVSLSTSDLGVSAMCMINTKGIKFNSSVSIKFRWIKHSTEATHTRYLDSGYILRGV